MNVDGFQDSLPVEAPSCSAALSRGPLARVLCSCSADYSIPHPYVLCPSMPCQARLIRWDQAGAIVTKSFNYVENPRFLAKRAID
ncbi:hypothetical protein BS47DRAFT_1344868 [Hydnum rufescens UP504]|uniref:Uncharacterized protein n=1 Tax=Hydnum rufescens UP504 TaxID=1448309 RepID=A0A9P6AY53_9AGAM|nr:hypothetical protein BS47DRAFT_1344868 [Hydnum rufescens UP504]